MLKANDLDFHKGNVDNILEDLDWMIRKNAVTGQTREKAKQVADTLTDWAKHLDKQYGTGEYGKPVEEISDGTGNTD